MKTQKPAIHLLSLPWAKPNYPSIQIGALKAYIDSAIDGEANCYAYSAYLNIYFNAFGTKLFDKFYDYHKFRELTYLFIYAKNFINPGLDYKSLVNEFNKHDIDSKITPTESIRIEEATFNFIEEVLVPNLSTSAPNIIAFSLNYSQVYASLCCLEYLSRYHRKLPMTFVIGGMSAVQPHVVEVLKKLETDAFVCAGEGEKKLTKLLKETISLHAGNQSKQLSKVMRSVEGVFHISDKVDLYNRDESLYLNQIKSIGELPSPDYAEYFSTLKSLCDSTSAFESLKSSISYLLIEGSRGCFAKCDFCGLTYLWDGFRTKSSKEVLSSCLELISKHGVPAVNFVDNVTDAWSNRFAKEIIRSKSNIKCFLEIRANHPFEYWVRLYLSGVDEVQIGIESISTPLLRHMNKGTTVTQNIRVHKYLQELEIKAYNNLITHHVHSELEDIKETKRILQATTHLRPFSLCRFGYQVGSPLYKRLNGSQKKNLQVQTVFPRTGVPDYLHKYLIDYLYEPTLETDEEQRLLTKEWDLFWDWYTDQLDKQKTCQPFLRVSPYNFEECQFSIIEDCRFNELEVTKIYNLESLIYQYCHDGMSEEKINKHFQLQSHETIEILTKFINKKWMLKLDQDYLSIATRPKNVVINEFITSEYEDRIDRLSNKTSSQKKLE